MNRNWTPALALAIAFCAVAASGARAAGTSAAAPDAKALFLKYRCNSCHGVQAAGIEKKAAAEDADSKDKSKKEPPELSGVGQKTKAEWIGKFLMKKEALDGEKHRKLFKGTPAELDTLSRWLESLKTPADKKGAKKANKK